MDPQSAEEANASRCPPAGCRAFRTVGAFTPRVKKAGFLSPGAGILPRAGVAADFSVRG